MFEVQVVARVFVGSRKKNFGCRNYKIVSAVDAEKMRVEVCKIGLQQ